MLINPKKLLYQARSEGWALGAFSAHNLEFCQAIVWAAEKIKSPVILQLSHKTLDYSEGEILDIALDLVQSSSVKMAVHLDHCREVDFAKEAIQEGRFTSVMFDGSDLPFDENVQKSKKLAELARTKNICFEAEIGRIGGPTSPEATRGKLADISSGEFKTNPQKAREFAEVVRPDSLAVAFGNIHGERVPGEKLDLELLEKIAQSVKIPLVFHGASNTPKGEIEQAIKLGIAKINVDTELQQTFKVATEKFLRENRAVSDPRQILTAGREAIQLKVEGKIEEFKNNQ